MKNQLLRINLTINEITKEIKVKILMGIANYAKNLLEIKIKDYIIFIVIQNQLRKLLKKLCESLF